MTGLHEVGTSAVAGRAWRTHELALAEGLFWTERLLACPPRATRHRPDGLPGFARQPRCLQPSMASMVDMDLDRLTETT